MVHVAHALIIHYHLLRIEKYAKDHNALASKSLRMQLVLGANLEQKPHKIN